MKATIALLIQNGPLPHANTKDFNNVLNVTLELAGALAFLMLVIAGFRYIISSGNPEKTATARRMMVYSLIGLVVIGLAWSIVNVVLKSL